MCDPQSADGADQGSPVSQGEGGLTGRTVKSLLRLPMITAAVLSLTACTSQNAYDSLRYYQEQDCQRLEKTDRDDCMRRSGMSYDEYQRELNKQEKEK